MAKSLVLLTNLLIISYPAFTVATVPQDEQYQFEIEKLNIESDSTALNETRIENDTEILNVKNEKDTENLNVNNGKQERKENKNTTRDQFDENGVPIVVFTRVDTQNENKTKETVEPEGCIADWVKDIMENEKSSNSSGGKNLQNDQIGYKNDSQGFVNENVSEDIEGLQNNPSVIRTAENAPQNDEQKNVTTEIDIIKTKLKSDDESKLNFTETTYGVRVNLKPDTKTSEKSEFQNPDKTLDNSKSEILNKSDINDGNSNLEEIIIKQVEEMKNSTVEIQKRNTENSVRSENVQGKTRARKIESRTLRDESDYLDIEHLSDKALNETEILSKYGNIMRIEKLEKLFDESGNRNESIGDLGVSVPEVEDVVGMQHGPRHKRKTKSSKEKLWPKGIVYYQISDGFSDDEANTIILAMKHIALRTKCIKFHPYTGKQKDWVKFKLGHDGCRANTGRQGGRQYIMLEVPVCVSSDPKTAHNVAHELGHILGLHHEHTRGDRDKYIEILWENIEKGEEINFRKEKDYLPDVPYSYNSIMHYSQYAFSPAGLKSMVPKMETKYVGSLGVYDKYDVEKVRKMYKCEGYDSYIE